jgi:hypothetical protein
MQKKATANDPNTAHRRFDASFVACSLVSNNATDIYDVSNFTIANMTSTSASSAEKAPTTSSKVWPHWLTLCRLVDRIFSWQQS